MNRLWSFTLLLMIAFLSTGCLATASNTKTLAPDGAVVTEAKGQPFARVLVYGASGGALLNRGQVAGCRIDLNADVEKIPAGVCIKYKGSGCDVSIGCGPGGDQVAGDGRGPTAIALSEPIYQLGVPTVFPSIFGPSAELLFTPPLE